MRFARILAPLLLVSTLAGCVSSPVKDAATPSVQASTAIRQAGELARQDAQLSGQARADNAREIERLLSSLDNQTLARDAAMLPPGDPLYKFAGRSLLRRGMALPRPFDSDQWQFERRPPAERDGYRPPVKLAVLLPLSGTLATAAQPVRDGLMAGYYGEQRRRPEVVFFDTHGTAAGATAAYAQAVAAQADFVLGPLGRDEVDALLRAPEHKVPALVLNRGDVPPPEGMAGFSLAPEDDGIMAAEYLLDRERRHVLVIGGNDETSQRAARAFAQRFSERGGGVAGQLNVADAPGNLSAALASAAQGEVDAVFLAVKGSTARLLAPQLALAGLGGKSRVGTSQLLTGTGKALDDAALDGIVFPTETWTVRSVAGLPAAGAVGSRLSTARGPAARLFAFGYDAWLLTAYLEKLSLDTHEGLHGATGRLRMDGFGNVLRTPAWSTFRGGTAVPIADGG